jgi:hypothetical protein
MISLFATVAAVVAYLALYAFLVFQVPKYEAVFMEYNVALPGLAI